MQQVIFKRIRRWFRRRLRVLRRAFGGGGRGRRGKRKARRKRRQRPPTALGTFGTRLGRHAGIYGAGQGGSLVMGLITLAVLTRFLEPAEFGQYALYYFLAGLLMILYTLGWHRGSLLWVFGGAGDDDEEDEEDEEGGEAAAAQDKRRALGTAIVLVALIGVLGTAVLAAIAPTVAELLTGEGDDGRLALLAGAGGAAGAIWVLAASVPRRERRPTAYVVLHLGRPVLILAVTVPLVAIDPGVEAAVVGVAAGNAGAALLALAGIRRSFSFGFASSDARNIARLGVRYVPLTLSLWVIANGGVFFLGQYASPSDAGFFRVATGVAAVASLPAAAFITAWGPLRREPIFGAVEAERGRLAAAGLLASYFALGAIGIMLALVLGADLLVRVAPGAYEEAAPLIPLVGLGLLLQGWYRVLRRSAKFRDKRTWYISLAVVAALVFVGACVVLIPPLETDGAALAIVAAFLVAAVGMSLRSQLGREPIPFAYGRIVAGLAIAAACFGGARLLGGVAGDLAPLMDIAAVVAYPLLLVATGAIPAAHLAPLRGFARAALPGRARDLDGRVDLNGLDETQRAVLEILVRHRRPADDVAPMLGIPRAELDSSFVAALRLVGGVGDPSQADAGIGDYLLSSAPVAARDQLWRRLSAQGADALEVDALSLTLERLRRAPVETWRRP